MKQRTVPGEELATMLCFNKVSVSSIRSLNDALQPYRLYAAKPVCEKLNEKKLRKNAV